MATDRPPDTTDIEQANAVRVITLCACLGYIYVVIAVPVLFLVLHNYFLGIVSIIAGLGVTVALVHARTTKTVELGRRIIAYMTAMMVVAAVLDPTIFGAGVYLMIPVYIFIFYLTNRRHGARILLSIFSMFLIAYGLNLAGILELSYPKINFAIFLFCYFLAFLFFILASVQKEHLDARLSASVKEVEVLVARLKREKTLVEHKVEQRTRELSDAQAELMASIRSLPFGFALINAKSEVVFANSQLRLLLDRPENSRADSAVPTIEDLHTALSPMVRLKTLLKHSQAGNHAIERNIQRNTSFYRLYCAPIVGGSNQPIGTVLIVENTTAQRVLERSRDEFFSIASHELRTPLTAIRGNTDLITSYYPQVLKDPRLKEMVDDIHGASIRLIDIVNDFLDMSRLEMRKIDFKFTNFDIADLVADVLREYDVTGSRKKLHLTLEPPEGPVPQVYADQDRVRQIIVNLLGNAVKFTEHGSVTISVKPVGGLVKVNVTDTGRGIRPDMRHLLFQKFQQATRDILTRDNTRGTGLGLYISKLLAEGMKGKLYIESSEVGKGSTFTLELPLS